MLIVYQINVEIATNSIVKNVHKTNLAKWKVLK